MYYIMNKLLYILNTETSNLILDKRSFGLIYTLYCGTPIIYIDKQMRCYKINI